MTTTAYENIKNKAKELQGSNKSLRNKKSEFLVFIKQQNLNIEDAKKLANDYLAEFNSNEWNEPFFLFIFTEDKEKCIGSFKEIIADTHNEDSVITGHTKTHNEFLKILKQAVLDKLDSKKNNVNIAHRHLNQDDFNRARNIMKMQRGRLFKWSTFLTPWSYEAKFEKMEMEFKNRPKVK